MIVWFLIILATVAADQVSKLLVVNFLSREESLPIIKGILQFTYVENDGAAFGSFDDKRWVFMVASTIMIVGLIIYLWKFPPKSKLACVAMAMIAGGGIGNMIDRIRLEYVIDFIDFCAFPELWMWVFNVADSAVCVGCAMLFLWAIISSVEDFKADKRAKSCADTENATESKNNGDEA